MFRDVAPYGHILYPICWVRKCALLTTSVYNRITCIWGLFIRRRKELKNDKVVLGKQCDVLQSDQE